MHPQCSWVMLIGISAHCAKLTQDIPRPTLPDSTRRTVKFCRMFSSFPQGSEKMQGTESQRKVKPIKKREREYFFRKTKRCGYSVRVPSPRLEKVTMHFWTFTLNKATFPPWDERREGLEIHKSSCKEESTPALPPDSVRFSLTGGYCTKPIQLAVVKRRCWRGDDFSSFGFWRGAFSEELDPWTGSAVLNILLTVCLPRADLPDMLSSRLAGDATSLRISPATRKAPLHFLWINSRTVGEEERPGHRGTRAEMRRKHTHTHTFFLWRTTHTTLATIWTPLVRAWWILWKHPVNWNDLKPLF